MSTLKSNYYNLLLPLLSHVKNNKNNFFSKFHDEFICTSADVAVQYLLLVYKLTIVWIIKITGDSNKVKIEHLLTYWRCIKYTVGSFEAFKKWLIFCSTQQF